MDKKRHLIQFLSGLIMNGNLPGWVKSKIYTGTGKYICLPILNCYSCPGALGACPIGSLQATARNGIAGGWSFYVLGFLALIGVLVGRLICGWLCLFGFVQDLLYHIPTPKIRIPEPIDRPLRKLKYAVLLCLVLLFPLFLPGPSGVAIPYFCKYLCPAGTLEGGIPLLLGNESLRGAIGVLFSWKMAILAGVLIVSILTYRPFCKYLCPLGVFYGLFNRFSFFRYTVDSHLCVGCGKCAAVCKMNVDPVNSANSSECIRCGACKTACPVGAITHSLQQNHKKEKSVK